MGWYGALRASAEVRPVRNVEMQNPEVRYLIDDKEDMRIRKELYKSDLDVLGYYHSHPNHPAQPSIFDTERVVPCTACVSNGYVTPQRIVRQSATSNRLL